MEIKPAQVKLFLQSPPQNLRVILVYGPDRGAVSERTRKLVKFYSGATDDAFTVSRMNGSDIISDQSPLFDEYLAIPMFAPMLENNQEAKKSVWIFDDGSQIHKQIKNLLDDKQDGNIVIIEGRDLKKTSALVKHCIKHKLAATIPCYQDSIGDISQLVREILGENQLKITTENLNFLQSMLGNDRQLSRSEIEKLALYCLNKPEVDQDDILSCLTGDAAKFSFDKLLDAIAGGRVNLADKELCHFLQTGDHPVMIFAIIRNHFNMLHIASAGVAQGRPAEMMVNSMRPPIFYNRKAAITSQLRNWRLKKCDMAQVLIAEADIDARMNNTLAKDILNRLVTRLSLMAGR